ncbi:M1 family metallopeptidase [Psychrosphaera sp.]|nr:M1 family metallopeptidase [Psychrosphaera sp.]
MMSAKRKVSFARTVLSHTLHEPAKSIFLNKMLCSALLTFSLGACSKIPELDPIIGDTGNPFSEVAESTDVIEYAIDLEIFPSSQSIAGSGSATFLITKATAQVELKLDNRFTIDKVEVAGVATTYTVNGGVITIDLPNVVAKGDTVTASVFYSGKPHVALNAPWDGGFVWSQTPTGKDWIATAVQGEGCDLFWPCKDHYADKAETTRIHLTVPDGLVAATNGVLQKSVPLSNNRIRYEWLLQVPASDYNIALNIGPYQRIQKSYTSVNGKRVPIEFWALPQSVDKATTMIDDDLMHQIEFFENMIGPYPWYTEKLGFVETPHLGMEHQTINAYGKKYVRDEHGFDFLLHHELAHEWFGNVMTHEKLNDAWLHEGFGLYMQPAYSLYRYGEAAYQHRMYESYLGLVNCHAIVLDGDITSNQAFNSDIYGKGGWTLHTLRWLIGDEKFWQATRDLVYGEDFELNDEITPRYRNTQEFIDIVNKVAGDDYTWLFNVYLKQAELPNLKTDIAAETLTLNWQVPGNVDFPMPIPVSINGEINVIDVPTGGASIEIPPGARVIVDPEMKVLRKLPIIGSCEENLAKRAKRK